MISYKNGNTTVLIFWDGTKIRHVPDNEIPQPVKPESIDLKITDYCDHHCLFCYEHSTPSGGHGNLDHPILDTLSYGTELAIGGGDPLSHPGLVPFLKKMKDKGVICNLTIHCHAYCRNRQLVNGLCNDRLIHGLGLSVGDEVNILDELLLRQYEMPLNVIFHTIIGITPNSAIKRLSKTCKVLLLGSKTQLADTATIDELRSFISENQNIVKGLYFDNLACGQLHIQSLVSEDVWEERYMGDDGRYTMFIDLIRERGYASSIVDRNSGFAISNCASINDLFQKVRNSAV
jgi:hypothetical protein